MPTAGIQLLRDQTRLRKSLVENRTGWAQRLHALLAHEGCRAAAAACSLLRDGAG
jgi:hypothetical protein